MTARRISHLFAIAVLVCTAAAAQTPQAGNSITIQPDREFSASSHVHKPLAPDAPLDPRSRAMVAELLRQVQENYKTIAVESGDYSPPIYVVSADQPVVKVLAQRSGEPAWSLPALQGRWMAVPVPDDFKPAAGTDKEAVIYQPATGRYWEFWAMEPTGAKTRDSAGREVAQWRAGWGGAIDNLARNPGYFETTPEGFKFGGTATGLPYLAGVVTIKELQQGSIDHALHFAIPKVRKTVWSFPAQRTDGLVDDANAIPQGAIFRFPASIDFDSLQLHPYGRMIAVAIQKHGMVLRDTAGAVVIYAENPAGRYAVDPYSGPGGILQCPNGVSEEVCWPDSGNRLAGIPWDKLQVLKTSLSR